MGMEWEAAMDGFMEFMLLNYPKAELGEDNDGQLVIYTGLKQHDDGHIGPFDEDVPSIEKGRLNAGALIEICLKVPPHTPVEVATCERKDEWYEIVDSNVEENFRGNLVLVLNTD